MPVGRYSHQNQPSKYQCDIMSRIYFSISSQWQYETFLAKALKPLDNLKVKFQTARSQIKKKFSFQSGGDTTGGLMWENSQALRESAEFQINFKPLSPVNAKPQQLSCCELILLFALSPPVFWGGFSRWRERLKPTAKNNQQHTPREADIPRTYTSTVRSSVGPALRTMLWNVAD